jgi:NADH:ubiquinone oxidoreductase subunit E
MGMELDEIAEDGEVKLSALVELAEDRGRPASHYLAALPLATELTLAKDGGTEVRICAGNCQSYGALVLLDHLVERAQKNGGLSIVPVECLDNCDVPAVCELRGAGGQLVLTSATKTSIDEALDALK